MPYNDDKGGTTWASPTAGKELKLTELHKKAIGTKYVVLDPPPADARKVPSPIEIPSAVLDACKGPWPQ